MNLSKKDKISVALIAGFILVLGTLAAWAILVVDFDMNAIDQNQTSQPCTLEALICPDGSTVGREGPDCEFSECPDQTAATRPFLL